MSTAIVVGGLAGDSGWTSGKRWGRRRTVCASESAGVIAAANTATHNAKVHWHEELNRNMINAP
ncbi:MAG: hypothetical protein CMM00_15570 [Rhodopirellula sp.]|uniref:Uncharacterized protein n=1 Tax=Rhodopirellula europaea SH398 TaxID=1263868 RepID=M5SC06_9BACT|nr:hypothetical protein RESH_00296 [Rhodopirellula europaea SH398]MAP10132.1 hypothetical protein [Rhodopirellula sp.]